MLYSRLIDIFRRRRRQPEVGLKTSISLYISRMVYGIAIRLADMKALAVVKQQ